MKEQLMSSAKDDWNTPNWLFQELDNIFHFHLDAAADDKNHKCDLYIDQEMNALKTDWKGLLSISSISPTNTVWLNPPYGSKILLPFIEKVVEEYDKGLTVVVLTAARTETKWFQLAWDRARYLLFLKGRLKFEVDGKSIGPATFPSSILVFTPHKWNLHPLTRFGKLIEQNVVTKQELFKIC